MKPTPAAANTPLYLLHEQRAILQRRSSGSTESASSSPIRSLASEFEVAVAIEEGEADRQALALGDQ